jgi:hypothetical protein
LDKENKFKEGSWKASEKKKLSCVFSGEEENECVKRELVVMCEEMLFMEVNGLQTKEHGRKLCVASSCSGVHGMISMNKPIDCLLK